jgi:hypothetical protein
LPINLQIKLVLINFDQISKPTHHSRELIKTILF